mmetsp:Transcript_14913/g.14506  ORF Transcript_14913/g.14506 Transcript_14913/m.14506 type:complete len:107 (-) Transcript_14913:35-355(-)
MSFKETQLKNHKELREVKLSEMGAESPYSSRKIELKDFNKKKYQNRIEGRERVPISEKFLSLQNSPNANDEKRRFGENTIEETLTQEIKEKKLDFEVRLKEASNYS